MSDRNQIVSDLALLDLTLVASAEGCRCSMCQTLDLKHDIDFMAEDELGRLFFVSYRRQEDYLYETLTIRHTTENGSENTQFQKILERRSRADLIIQSYKTHIVFTYDFEALRDALKWVRDNGCEGHPFLTRGDKGALFATACQMCFPDIRVAHRTQMRLAELPSLT